MSVEPDLPLEAEELRRRVRDAEETIRAIRDGEVDALVVRNADSDEVFSLAGGRESYRAFMEAMDIGAAALDSDGRLLYANAALCKLLGQTFAGLQQAGLLPAIGAGAESVEALVAGASAGRQASEIELRLYGRLRHVLVTAAPMPLEFSQGYALTFADITDRIAAASAEESERIGRAIMMSANEPVIVCDRNGVITHVTAPVQALCKTDPVGSSFADVFPLSFPLGSGMADSEDFVALALGGNSANGIEARLDGDPPRDWLLSAAPLRLASEAVGGCIITMIDLSARKSAEQRQTFLINELNHRVKNTLTLVLAISGRTISSASSLEDFRERFSRRIEALAATHNLLVNDSWESVSLRQLFEAELAPYLPARSARIVYADLDVPVPPRTAIALGLVIHELVTNAVKYGSLSNASGRVFVDTAPQPDGAFEIVWREEGGPPVQPPSRSGFGQTLIARSLGRDRAQVEFRPDGVVCSMRLAASDLSF